MDEVQMPPARLTVPTTESWWSVAPSSLHSVGWDVGGVLDRSPVDVHDADLFEAADTGAGQGAEGAVEVAIHDQLDGLLLHALLILLVTDRSMREVVLMV
jgi:hypothetical protein